MKEGGEVGGPLLCEVAEELIEFTDWEPALREDDELEEGTLLEEVDAIGPDTLFAFAWAAAAAARCWGVEPP